LNLIFNACDSRDKHHRNTTAVTRTVVRRSAMFKNALFLIFLMTSLIARISAAGDVLYYGAHDMPDPEVVARILSEPAKVARPLKMRSIRLVDDNVAQAPSTGASPAAAHAGPSALGLPVQFAFDSTALLPQAMAQLDALAEGIRRTDPGVRVIVEGHTDAVGTPEYNLRLSALRAQAVKTYLVSRHGIDAARLRVIGKGLFAPIEGRDPFAPENRRVEFRADHG